MANKRMFSRDLVSSDYFCDMPVSSQALYFHLNINADDDGFVSPKRIMRGLGYPDDDLKVLIAKGFVIPFNTGVIVITHWKRNNTIQLDRYTPTQYQNEFSSLALSKDKTYINGNILETSRLPDKIRLDKIRKEETDKENLHKYNRTRKALLKIKKID